MPPTDESLDDITPEGRLAGIALGGLLVVSGAGAAVVVLGRGVEAVRRDRRRMRLAIRGCGAPARDRDRRDRGRCPRRASRPTTTARPDGSSRYVWVLGALVALGGVLAASRVPAFTCARGRLDDLLELCMHPPSTSEPARWLLAKQAIVAAGLIGAVVIAMRPRWARVTVPLAARGVVRGVRVGARRDDGAAGLRAAGRTGTLGQATASVPRDLARPAPDVRLRRGQRGREPRVRDRRRQRRHQERVGLAVDPEDVDPAVRVGRVDDRARRVRRRPVRRPRRSVRREVEADLADVPRVVRVEEAHALLVPADRRDAAELVEPVRRAVDRERRLRVGAVRLGGPACRSASRRRACIAIFHVSKWPWPRHPPGGVSSVSM